MANQDDVSPEELEYRKTKYSDLSKLPKEKIICLACGKNLKPKTEDVYCFKRLGVLLCQECNNNQSKEVKTDTCILCNKLAIFCCGDKNCENEFCKKCLKRGNPLSIIEAEDDDWECFQCDTTPIWEARAICSLVMGSKQKVVKKNAKRSSDDDTKRPRRNNEGSIVVRERAKRHKKLIKNLQKICDSESSSEDRPTRPMLTRGLHIVDKVNGKSVSEWQVTKKNAALAEKLAVSNSDSDDSVLEKATNSSKKKVTFVPSSTLQSMKTRDSCKRLFTDTCESQTDQDKSLKKDIITKNDCLLFKQHLSTIAENAKVLYSSFKTDIENLKYRCRKTELKNVNDIVKIVTKYNTTFEKLQDSLVKEQENLINFYGSWSKRTGKKVVQISSQKTTIPTKKSVQDRNENKSEHTNEDEGKKVAYVEKNFQNKVQSKSQKSEYNSDKDMFESSDDFMTDSVLKKNKGKPWTQKKHESENEAIREEQLRNKRERKVYLEKKKKEAEKVRAKKSQGKKDKLTNQSEADKQNSSHTEVSSMDTAVESSPDESKKTKDFEKNEIKEIEHVKKNGTKEIEDTEKDEDFVEINCDFKLNTSNSSNEISQSDRNTDESNKEKNGVEKTFIKSEVKKKQESKLISKQKTFLSSDSDASCKTELIADKKMDKEEKKKSSESDLTNAEMEKQSQKALRLSSSKDNKSSKSEVNTTEKAKLLNEELTKSLSEDESELNKDEKEKRAKKALIESSSESKIESSEPDISETEKEKLVKKLPTKSLDKNESLIEEDKKESVESMSSEAEKEKLARLTLFESSSENVSSECELSETEKKKQAKTILSKSSSGDKKESSGSESSESEKEKRAKQALIESSSDDDCNDDTNNNGQDNVNEFSFSSQPREKDRSIEDGDSKLNHEQSIPKKNLKRKIESPSHNEMSGDNKKKQKQEELNENMSSNDQERHQMVNIMEVDNEIQDKKKDASKEEDECSLPQKEERAKMTLLQSDSCSSKSSDLSSCISSGSDNSENDELTNKYAKKLSLNKVTEKQKKFNIKNNKYYLLDKKLAMKCVVVLKKLDLNDLNSRQLKLWKKSRKRMEYKKLERYKTKKY